MADADDFKDEESYRAWKEKIASVQVPRQPHVDQRTAGGSTQTHHTTGRVDAQIVIDQPIKASMKVNQPDGGDE